MRAKKLFEIEQQKAREEGAQVSVERRSDGKVVLTIRSKAKGDYSQSDYLKNKTVFTSDNTRVYTFDARTHRLEDLEVYVDLEGKDVLVFETTAIRYDLPVTASMFEPDIPKDAVWSMSADEMGVPDNHCTTPRETAEATLKALADEDWDTLRGLAGNTADEPKFREFAGGLEIISIGEPFQSGSYPGWFVPYEVRLKNDAVKKNNLAVRNDTRDGRWIFDGGF